MRTDTYETFMNPDIAVQAIVHHHRGEMKQKLSGFLQIMYDLNPDAVGGTMPGDDFYYIPANN